MSFDDAYAALKFLFVASLATCAVILVSCLVVVTVAATLKTIIL